MESDVATRTKQSAGAKAVRATTLPMSPAMRKVVLAFHIVFGIGWMGVDIALFVLLINARMTNDPQLVVSAFNAIAMIVPAAVPVLSLGILATGLALGLGTRWGLVRYWWVLGKLALSLVMTALVFGSLLPGVSAIPVLVATGASAESVRASLDPLPTMLLFPPVVSFLMLGVAVALSIFKPGQQTPWSRNKRGASA
jgi:hypothetical protein